jgi:hypothetical protein
MRAKRVIDNERGIALVVVLLVVLAVAAVIAGAAVLGSSTSLIQKHQARLSTLETVADAGLEEARSRLNGDRTLFIPTPPDSFRTLDAGATVYAADGSVIPNVKRWLYVGPSGITTGQYGVTGSIVAMARDAQGNQVVRRGEVYQESFSKYAYFTTVEGVIYFANGDQIFGPVHSNDVLHIASSGATFFGPVTTAATISGRSYGTYKQGYQENAPAIAMPTTADLTNLKQQAIIGGTSITSTMLGNAGQATTRIEFVALDLNGDLDSSDADEGFIRVYQVANPANAWWVVADTNNWSAGGPTQGVRDSPNCGHIDAAGFTTFRNHLPGGGPDSKSSAPGISLGRGCFLGGDDHLNAPIGFASSDSYGYGSWLLWSGIPDPRVTAAAPAMAAYLWPINRVLNPNFKGVIYVDGKVAVSGTLRGRVTLAATGNIIIADDIKYVTDPAAGTCADILGLFSGIDVVVADNLINDPIPWTPGQASVTWDLDSKDEFINAFVLALGVFTAEQYNQGATKAENCDPATDGRGCLYLNGGIIQRQRGPVGLTTGQGYIKRYSYDACGLTDPPPYFPTTGHFYRGHYYEVDPTNFNIASYWSLLIPH